MVSEEQQSVVINAVQTASAKWQAAFNAGDAAGCAAQYEATAVMHAKPFGTYNGSAEIEAFWSKLISDGFSDVEYINPQLEVIDETSAILKSQWRMNKASGEIQRELWVLQDDGTARLREDEFSAND